MQKLLPQVLLREIGLQLKDIVVGPLAGCRSKTVNIGLSQIDDQPMSSNHIVVNTINQPRDKGWRQDQLDKHFMVEAMPSQLLLLGNNIIEMEGEGQGQEFQLKIHQILNRNGFYRLPLHKLLEILKLLEMPEARQARKIQQLTIKGLIKLINGIHAGESARRQSKKYFNEGSSQEISIEIKNYLSGIVEELLLIGTQLARKENQSLTQAMTSYPYLQMSYPTFQPEIEERMKMQMYYMNMYNYGNPPQMVGRSFFPNYQGMEEPKEPKESKESKEAKGSRNSPVQSRESIEKQAMNIKQANAELKFDRESREFEKEMNENERIDVEQINNEVIQVFKHNSDLEDNNAKMSKEIEIQTDLSLLNAQIELLPKVRNEGSKMKMKKTKKLKNGVNVALEASLQVNVPTQKEKEPSIQKPKEMNQFVVNEIDHKPQAEPNLPEKESHHQQKNYILTVDKDYLTKGERVPQRLELKRNTSEFERFENLVKQNIKVLKVAPGNPFKDCLCRGQLMDDHHFQCSNCKNRFHYRCSQLPQIRGEQECLLCKLATFNPINEVKEVIGTYYIENISKSKFEIEVSVSQYEYFLINKIRNHEILLRCLRIGDNYDPLEITWPDEVYITINGKIVNEIQGLSLCSSLKKRKDSAIVITNSIFHEDQYEHIRIGISPKTVTSTDIANKLINNAYTYLLGIYFIEKIPIEMLLTKFEQGLNSYPQDFIASLMKGEDEDIEIEKVVCNLNDPYSKRVMSTPVRGNKCLHGQCFDLKTYLQFMYATKNRSWRCPICSKQAKKFILDRQMLQLIKRSLQDKTIPNEISFMKDGRILLKIATEADNDEDSPMEKPKMKKTKYISKKMRDEESQVIKQFKP